MTTWRCRWRLPARRRLTSRPAWRPCWIWSDCLRCGIGIRPHGIDNSKKIRFGELEAAQLPRSLDDLDASAVNTNFVLSAGLNPARDAIALEAAKSAYVNLLAVREQDKDKPWVAKLVKASQSEVIRKAIQTEFKSTVLAGF